MFLNTDIFFFPLLYLFLIKIKGNMETQLHTAEITGVGIDEKIHQACSYVLP